MFFQILDEKRQCKKIFYHDELVDNLDEGEMTHTWSYSPHLRDKQIEYASIWCAGTSLDNNCPENLKEEWKEINQKATAFLKSFKTARINLHDNCLFNLLPEDFLLQFYRLKNEITKSVFENCEKPENYDFLSRLMPFIDRIKNTNLNLKFENLDFSDEKTRASFNKIKQTNHHIDYNMWGTATGRLATRASSFPILNLNKELRPAIHPNNDVFVEFDYNAAELRVLFALLGQEQPGGDVHEWISKNIFDSKYDRETSKKKAFAWLYNPRAKNKKLNDYLQREKILEDFYKDGSIATSYGRLIPVSEDKAVNYTIQSTTSDLFLNSALKIDNLLENKKSSVAFCVHDSLILDFSREDKDILSMLIEEFSKTGLGNFKTNVNIGKNYGSMRKIQ